MVKLTVQRKTTAPVAQDEIERSLAALAARKQFMSVALSMGWQLAFAVVIPVIVGVKIDDHFHTSPSYTLAAFILAIGMAAWIVMNTIKEVNQESAESGSPTASDAKGEK